MPSPLLFDLTAKPCRFLNIVTAAPDFYGTGFPPLINHRVVAAASFCLKPESVDSGQEPPVFSPVAVDLGKVGDKEAVSWCSKLLQEAADSTVVTFYGETFLFPVLFYRCLSLGLPLTFQGNSVDLADLIVLRNVGLRQLSISDSAELIGLPKRYNVNIMDRYQEHDVDTLLGCVATDMLISVLVYLRLLLVSGTIAKDQFRQVGRAVMSTFYNTGDLPRDYVKASDVRAFLFAPPRKPKAA